jgi:mono/diheme cytochrome c family protein
MRLGRGCISVVLLGGAIFAGRLMAADAPPDEWKAPSRAAAKKNPIAANADSIAAGKNVYIKQCLSCHGTAGKGDGPASKDLNPKPHDLGAPAVVAQTDGALFWKITEGRKPMPTFDKLTTEEERWHVINYVRTLAPKSTTTGDGKGDSK